MKCPNCQKEIDMREVMMDEDLVAVFAALPKFGEYSRLAHEYCEKFGVVPYAKNLKKLGRLLLEVAALFEQRRFAYQKRQIEVSLPVIVEGLKTVCNKRFDVPLENHNYLKKVLITLAEKEGQAEQAKREKYLRDREAGAERKEHSAEGIEQEENTGSRIESDMTEKKGKRISDWIRESKVADSIGRPMP